MLDLGVILIMPSNKNPIKIPDIIPEKCEDCEYFQERKDIFGRTFRGPCDFYDRIYMDYDSKCLAVTRYGKSPSIKCSNCSTVNNPEAIFCIQCGKEIACKEMITISYCEECNAEYDKLNKELENEK